MIQVVRTLRPAAIEALEWRVLLAAAPPQTALAHHTYVLERQFGNLSANTALAQALSPATTPTLVTPTIMRHAYGVDNIKFNGLVGDGTGQTIAIVDAYDDPSAAADLTTFDQLYGLADPPSFQVLNEYGQTAPLPTTDPEPSPGTWELEESLDIEWAHVIAPNANIILYEANAPTFEDLAYDGGSGGAVYSAENNPAVSVISMSWSGGEFAGENTLDSVFTTPASRGNSGVSFFAATGDGGAPGGYPAYSPNVVAVGGTTLLVNPDGSYNSENGWTYTGGGISSQESEPAYQTSVQTTGMRTTPDISMDADGSSGVLVFDSHDGGWFEVGGTSLATPMWAAITAIADQGRANYGLGSLDGPTQLLPMLYELPKTFFHDVVSGNNFGFSAGPGYDEVTGIGTPIADELIPALAQPYVGSLTASPNPVLAPNVITLTASVGDLNGTVGSVSFYHQGTGGLADTLLGTVTDGTAGWSVTTPTTGLTVSANYYAVAKDINGIDSVATFTTLNIAPAPATAAFVTTDSTTQGTWTGVYGADGYSIFNGNTNLPEYAHVSPVNALNWTWPTDARGLQTSPDATGRIDACDYSTSSFTLNVNLTDGNTHQVALYMLDWENLGYVQSVQVSDALTGIVLDTRAASNFASGQWLVWNLSGDVNITLTRQSGPATVASGIFFGPIPKAATATFVAADKTTQGTWTGTYGADGYSIFGGNSSLPSYAQLSASNQSSYVWEGTTTDPRGLQTSPGSNPRIDATYYSTTSFSLNLKLTDGNTHQVALYLLDYARLGYVQSVSVSDAFTGAVLDNRTASNFGNGAWLVWNLSGNVKITLTVNSGPATVASGIFFGPVPTTATASFVNADTATQGTWTGTYGADGYSIFNGNTSLPAYARVLPSNQSSYLWQANTSDPRGLQSSPGSANRIEAAYDSATSFSLNVNLTDGNVHRVALYLLDYASQGYIQSVTLSDAASGAVLDTRTASNFGNGQWLVWNLSGNVKITLTVNSGPATVASGIFFGPVPTTSTASFVTTDNTTQGTWTGTYGADGYSVFNANRSLPSYATVTPSNQSGYVWEANTSDPRGLQSSSGSASRIDACYYSTTSFSLNVNLTDGNPHQVALYMMDYARLGYVTTVTVSDAFTGTVLDTRTASNFGNGQWLVWNLSGKLRITITDNSGPATVASGIFFGPVPSTATASFLATDNTTQGTWTGTYGADGYSIFDGNLSLPGYAKLSASSQSNYVWEANTSDPRGLQSSSGSSSRIDACYYSTTSFSLNVNLTDGQSHRVALYLMDYARLGYVTTVTVSDALTGTVLDTRTASNFGNGQWLVWNLTGNVKITLTNTSGPATVASGIFFG